jgi:hypothetical protein
MREIAFRGKRKDNGEWVYGDLIHLPGGIITIRYNIKADPETAGQYTGLTDKNGEKIFEGDICRIQYHDGRSDIGRVDHLGARFNDGDYYYLDFLNGYADIEVIGNIHDNPQLLGRE